MIILKTYKIYFNGMNLSYVLLILIIWILSVKKSVNKNASILSMLSLLFWSKVVVLVRPIDRLKFRPIVNSIYWL